MGRLSPSGRALTVPTVSTVDLVSAALPTCLWLVLLMSLGLPFLLQSLGRGLVKQTIFRKEERGQPQTPQDPGTILIMQCRCRQTPDDAPHAHRTTSRLIDMFPS